MPLLLSGARRRESQGASSDTCPPVCATHRWRLPSFSAPSPQVSGSRDRTNMEPPHPPTHPGWAPTEAGVRHIAHLLAEVHTPGANQGQVRKGGEKEGQCVRPNPGVWRGANWEFLLSPLKPFSAGDRAVCESGQTGTGRQQGLGGVAWWIWRAVPPRDATLASKFWHAPRRPPLFFDLLHLTFSPHAPPHLPPTRSSPTWTPAGPTLTS